MIRKTMTVLALGLAMTAAGASGATCSARSAPITRARVPDPSRTSTVYSPSCGCSASRIAGRRRLTPHTPQRGSPAASRSSKTTAWWARWKLPTPRCTTPTADRPRS